MLVGLRAAPQVGAVREIRVRFVAREPPQGAPKGLPEDDAEHASVNPIHTSGLWTHIGT
jgi:hypothetical protein